MVCRSRILKLVTVHGNHSPLNRSHHHLSLVTRVCISRSADAPSWPSAPYGPMAKPYHPCYTDVNPAVEARKYTSEQVYYRKVTLMYDWLAPDRDVEGWSRRVPYRLERGQMEGSWVVKYFEFRAGIGPLIGVGFIGDLWISWNPEDPSVWFKVEEDKWERWGGCASSVRVVSLFFHSFFFVGDSNIITITHAVFITTP